MACPRRLFRGLNGEKGEERAWSENCRRDMVNLQADRIGTSLGAVALGAVVCGAGGGKVRQFGQTKDPCQLSRRVHSRSRLPSFSLGGEPYRQAAPLAPQFPG